MDKVDMAIERLRVASDMSLAVYQQPLIITDSGGKDSSVLVDLALKAKIPCEIQHSHTTADAPETVRFVREKFKRLEAEGQKVNINYPVYKGQRTSMWALIPLNYGPPIRYNRYCCSVLKETSGTGRMIATGIRWAESPKRSEIGIYETSAKKKENRITLANDNDDRRQLFENCTMKAKRVVNPIIDWSDREVWDYIHAERIPHNPLYYCGFNRVGCVGCPLASRHHRIRDFAYFPAYQNLYLLAFARTIAQRKAAGKVYKHEWDTAEKMMAWWMEDKNIDGQIDMFEEMEDT